MAVALALGACGSGGAHSKATGPTAAVRLRNFAIDAPPTVAAGDVTLRIFSAGPTMHELNVARTTLALKFNDAIGVLIEAALQSPGFRRTLKETAPEEPRP